MRARWLLLIAVALALVPAWALAGGDRGPSPAVFPAQRLPLTFSHAQHTGPLAIACVACHNRATTSTSAVDLLTPTEQPCRRCHAIARGPAATAPPTATATGACAACHPGEHTSWAATYHRTMTQRAGPDTVLAEAGQVR